MEVMDNCRDSVSFQHMKAAGSSLPFVANAVACFNRVSVVLLPVIRVYCSGIEVAGVDN